MDKPIQNQEEKKQQQQNNNSPSVGNSDAQQ